TEPWMVPFRPLEIVGECPHEITMHVVSLLFSSQHLRKMGLQVAYALMVSYPSIRHNIGKCGSIFGDIYPGDIRVGPEFLNHLVDGFGIHFPPHFGHGSDTAVLRRAYSC